MDIPLQHALHDGHPLQHTQHDGHATKAYTTQRTTLLRHLPYNNDHSTILAPP